MTDEQINRAIAEACGWKPKRQTKLTRMDFRVSYEDTPNYCADLNAMHEAEKVLSDDQFKWYTHWVEKLMPETKYRCYLCATARHRAEAFVRSLDKWEATVKDCLMVGKEVQP